MKITKKQAESFESFDAYVEKRFGKKEKAQMEEETLEYLKLLRQMQEEISVQVAKYMAKESIGFNELTQRLKTSTRQTSKIIKGEANLTLESIAQLAFLLGKKTHIVFK